jgi:preprotein translocase subunit SecA
LKIDVLRSSEFLAKSNCEENKKLFGYFGISSSCTVYENEIDENAKCKDIYSKSIVYTTSFKAQSYYIYDEFMGDGRRSGR